MTLQGRKRLIVGRTYYRTDSHPDFAADSVEVRLSCGHRKRYKGARVPKRFAYCEECRSKYQGKRGR